MRHERAVEIGQDAVGWLLDRPERLVELATASGVGARGAAATRRGPGVPRLRPRLRARLRRQRARLRRPRRAPPRGPRPRPRRRSPAPPPRTGRERRVRAPARPRRARRRPRPRRDRPAALAHPAEPRPPDRAAARGRRRRHPRRGDAGARGGRHRVPERRGARLPRRRRLRGEPGSPTSGSTAASSWSRSARPRAQFDITPRNPARRVTIGGRHMLLRQRLLAAERHGPRPRPPRRQHRGLPQPRSG